MKNPAQKPAPEVIATLHDEEALQADMFAATKPIPGLEAIGMRYAGNDQQGFFPCNETGAVMLAQDGRPMLWPTMAHLRLWAHSYLTQKPPMIVIPTGGLPPPRGKPD